MSRLGTSLAFLLASRSVEGAITSSPLCSPLTFPGSAWPCRRQARSLTAPLQGHEGGMLDGVDVPEEETGYRRCVVRRKWLGGQGRRGDGELCWLLASIVQGLGGVTLRHAGRCHTTRHNAPCGFDWIRRITGP